MKAWGWGAVVIMAVLGGCAAPKPHLTGDARETPAMINANLGVAYLQQGNLELAMQKLQRALELDPSLASAHHYIAQVYVQTRQPGEAERHYRKAVALDPADSMLQNNFGVFLCGGDKPKEGIEHLLAAVKDPFYKTPELVYENAGLCALRLPDMNKAENYYREALKINPRLPNSLYQMASIKYRQEEYLQARAFIQRYMEAAEPTAEGLQLAMQVEKRLGDREAEQKYGQILKKKYPEAAGAR